MSIIKKLGEKFEPLFAKIKGGYFGIIITIIGITTIVTCTILFSLSEPITFLTHWISDLGGVTTNSGASPNGSNIVFSVGLLIVVVFAIPFMIYLANYLLERNQKLPFLVSISFIFSIITLIGIVGVTIVDIKTNATIHTYFATLFFIGGMLLMFFFSLSMLFNSDISNKQALFGIICSIVPLSFLTSFTPFLLAGENIMDLVISTDPSLALSRFLEWMYAFILFAWFLEVSIYMLKNR